MKENTLDRYVVVGNPVAHSLSPRIHAEFARATGEDIEYTHRLVPLDGFAQVLAQLRGEGYRGANVTLPFKEDAFRNAGQVSARARAAAAVNTLRFDAAGIFGDNTDGCGLVSDLRNNLGVVLADRRILLVGAGGAARGVLQPLLAENPATLVIVNRTVERARALAALGGPLVQASAFADLAGTAFDIVINATSASIAGEVLPLPGGVFAAGGIAYDMMYGKVVAREQGTRDSGTSDQGTRDQGTSDQGTSDQGTSDAATRDQTVFLAWARRHGAARCADGLGMLVEQAAEAFYVWRGVRPATAPVLALLRS